MFLLRKKVGWLNGDKQYTYLYETNQHFYFLFWAFKCVFVYLIPFLAHF